MQALPDALASIQTLGNHVQDGGNQAAASSFDETAVQLFPGSTAPLTLPQDPTMVEDDSMMSPMALFAASRHMLEGSPAPGLQDGAEFLNDTPRFLNDTPRSVAELASPMATPAVKAECSDTEDDAA